MKTMGRDKTKYETQGELSFTMALKMVGIMMSNENAKLAYRIAIYSREKEGDISLKEIAVIASTLENKTDEI